MQSNDFMRKHDKSGHSASNYQGDFFGALCVLFFQLAPLCCNAKLCWVRLIVFPPLSLLNCFQDGECSDKIRNIFGCMGYTFVCIQHFSRSFASKTEMSSITFSTSALRSINLVFSMTLVLHALVTPYRSCDLVCSRDSRIVQFFFYSFKRNVFRLQTI